MVIVKDLPRKSKSYSQLLSYINRGRVEGDNWYFAQGFISENHYDIVKEYLRNFEPVKKHAKTNCLYHVIISIKRQENMTPGEHREIIADLLERYVEDRANNCLAYGAIHEADKHIHCHLMISSNEIGSDRNLRLSKSEFERKKQRLRDYAHERYPKLENMPVNEKRETRKSRQVDKEKHFTKRTGLQSYREAFKERLEVIFANFPSAEDFILKLQGENIGIYQRGQNWGFIDNSTGTKYRLKTLGLEAEFAEVNARISQKGPDKSSPAPGFDEASRTTSQPGNDENSAQEDEMNPLSVVAGVARTAGRIVKGVFIAGKKGVEKVVAPGGDSQEAGNTQTSTQSQAEARKQEPQQSGGGVQASRSAGQQNQEAYAKGQEAGITESQQRFKEQIEALEKEKALKKEQVKKKRRVR